MTCGLHEEGVVDCLMRTVFGDSFSKSVEGAVVKYIVVNKDLWSFVQGFGRGAHNKRIPEFVIGLKRELLLEFIEGYIDGDGCKVRENNYKSNKNSYSITTVSERLVYGVSAIISKVYGTLPNITKTIRAKKATIEGRVVNQRDTYMIRFHKERPRQSHYFIEGDFIWTPFKSRERVETGVEVFNIAVEEDNSYTVNNLIVHNCQAWSMAGQQQGDKDPRGMLFWTTLEVISHVLKHNPSVKWLMENVRMKREFEEYITRHTIEALGYVEKTLINSALVTAQNRNRYYWSNFPISQPDDKGLLLKDVLEDIEANRPCELLEKETVGGHIANATDIKGHQSIKRVYSPEGKSPTLTTMGGGHREPKVAIDELNYRKLTPLECERLQGYPDNYTEGVSNTQRYKQCGNGWTLPVITHIFKCMLDI